MKINDQNIDVNNIVLKEQATQRQKLEPSTLCKGLPKFSFDKRQEYNACLPQSVDIRPESFLCLTSLVKPTY